MMKEAIVPVLTKKNTVEAPQTDDALLIKHARTLRRWRNSIDAMLGEIGLEDEVLTIPRMARRGVPRTAKEAITPPSKHRTTAPILTRKVGRPRKTG